MINFCKKAGVPAPKFEDKGGFFSLTLRFKEPIRYIQASREPQPDLFAMLTPRQQEIIEILQTGPMGRKQIINKMKTPPADRTLQAELLTLNKLDLIFPEGKARAIVWGIKEK